MHASGGEGATTVRELIRTALANGDSGHVLHRLDGVLLVAAGRSLDEVADWFGVDRRTIQRWVHAAYAQGIGGLAEHLNGGRPAKLSSALERSIRLDLQASPGTFGYPDQQWTGKRLALHLHKHHHVTLSVRTCQRMILRSRDSPTSLRE